MFPVLSIGPVTLQTPGLIFILGLWVSLSLTEKTAVHEGISPKKLYNLILGALVGGVIGARIAEVANHPTAFSASPVSVLSPNPQLFDAWGGLAGGIVVALIISQLQKLPFWSTLDALAPPMAVFGIALSFSHLASGQAFGTPSNLPWKIFLWGMNRHPSQVYEMIAYAIIYLVISKRNPMFYNFPGKRFLTFVALAAGSRLVLEAYRGDSQLIFQSLRSTQVLAWIVLAMALLGINIISKQTRTNINQNLSGGEQ
jgi:phosphatidylglycerol:prolipoprotein diacylglycerol transferase